MSLLQSPLVAELTGIAQGQERRGAGGGGLMARPCWSSFYRPSGSSQLDSSPPCNHSVGEVGGCMVTLVIQLSRMTYDGLSGVVVLGGLPLWMLLVNCQLTPEGKL